MQITTYEQQELAGAIARAVRLQTRVLPLVWTLRDQPLLQPELTSIVLDALEEFFEPTAEDARAAEADRRLTGELEESRSDERSGL